VSGKQDSQAVRCVKWEDGQGKERRAERLECEDTLDKIVTGRH